MILPSTFPGTGRRAIRGPGIGGERKIAGFGFEAPALFAAAFGRNDARILFTAAAPANRYDFICTLPSRQGAALQDELKKELGLSGRLETRETDVLILAMRQTNAAGLQPSVAAPNTPASFRSSPGYLTGAGATPENLANELEKRLGIPVVDQTGLTNRKFDFELTWDQPGPLLNIDGLKQAVADQLGLELVAGRKSVEMVVVGNARK
jgi:uncharacterized protein (TIGR03435 family)